MAGERKPRGENIGVIRCMDFLGRIVIPKEFRTAMGIGAGSDLEMLLVKRGKSMEVVVKKRRPDDE